MEILDFILIQKIQSFIETIWSHINRLIQFSLFLISCKRLIFFFERLPSLTSYLNLRLHFINLLQFGSMKIFIKMIWIFFIFEAVDGRSPIRLQKWLIWSIIMFIFLTDIIMIPWNVCWLLIIFQHIIVSYWALICVEIYWVLGLRSLIKI